MIGQGWWSCTAIMIGQRWWSDKGILMMHTEQDDDACSMMVHVDHDDSHVSWSCTEIMTVYRVDGHEQGSQLFTEIKIMLRDHEYKHIMIMLRNHDNAQLSWSWSWACTVQLQGHDCIKGSWLCPRDNVNNTAIASTTLLGLWNDYWRIVNKLCHKRFLLAINV